MCNIVDHNGAVRVPVVHGSQRLVSFLAGRIPDLELHRGILVQGNRLREESGSDRRLPVVIELVLYGC